MRTGLPPGKAAGRYLTESAVGNRGVSEKSEMKGVKGWIAGEVREALPPFILFFAAFHMIALTKSIILEDHGMTAPGAALATLGALIVAKAVLLVEKLPVSRLFTERAIYSVLWKALLFGVVAMLFRALEELIHAIMQHEDIAGDAERLIAAVSWPHFLVLQMWLFALLFFYCLAASLASAIGGKTLKAMLLDRRTGRLGFE